MRLWQLLSCILIVSTKPSAGQLVVSASRYNLFYLGIENPIDYAVKDISMSQVELRASSGELLTNKEGNSFWRSCEAKPGKVVLSAYHRKTKRLIGEAEFRVKYLEDPIIAFDVDSTENYAALVGFPPNFADYDYPCRPMKYDLTFKVGNTHQTVTQDTYWFSDKTRQLIQGMLKGDTVIVSNIILKCGCIPEDRNMSTPLIFINRECGGIKSVCLKRAN